MVFLGFSRGFSKVFYGFKIFFPGIGGVFLELFYGFPGFSRGFSKVFYGFLWF